MTALYNEIDPYAAQWLRNLIAEGLIAPGDVAECSIEDLTPNDIRGYTQFHAFAGIGVWSLALRRAGWPDDRACWTFSEPCQPFSAAGKRGGAADERYLRPATHHLVRVCRPPVCFGEQVASKDGLGWLDTLQADMEGEGYAFGAVDTCSAGHGVEWEESQAGEWLRRAIHDCPDPWIAAQLGDFADFARGNFSEGGHHIRQRLRFVAERLEHAESDGRLEWRAEPGQRGAAGGCGAGRLGDDDDARLEGQRSRHQAASGRNGTLRPVAEAGKLGGLADTRDRERDGFAEFRGFERVRQDAGRAESGCGFAARRDDERLADAERFGREMALQHARSLRPSGAERQADVSGSGGASGKRPNPGHRNGRRVDWLFCRDGKWRATRSGAFPLASNAPSRVGRLRAYGNAVDAEATIQFIEAYLAAEADGFRLTEVSLSSRGQGVFG